MTKTPTEYRDIEIAKFFCALTNLVEIATKLLTEEIAKRSRN